MHLRHVISRCSLLLVLALGLAACENAPRPAPAAASDPKASAPAPVPAPAPAADGLVAGRDYAELPTGERYGPASAKIEVVEVFGYTCPHCARFEPMLNTWRGTLGDDVEFVRVPAPFGSWWSPYARAYYAAETLGIDGKSHEAVFAAIHDEKTLPGAPEIATNAQIAAFYGRFGVAPAKFAKVMDSYEVEAKIKHATQFIDRNGVDSTPSLVINGRYRAGGATPEDMLRIAGALIQRERKTSPAP